jgi:hypothetical protein
MLWALLGSREGEDHIGPLGLAGDLTVGEVTLVSVVSEWRWLTGGAPLTPRARLSVSLC